MMAGLLVAMPPRAESLHAWWLPSIWMILLWVCGAFGGIFHAAGMKLLDGSLSE